MNEIKLFENKEMGVSARTLLNDDGSISVNAEEKTRFFCLFKKLFLALNNDNLFLWYNIKKQRRICYYEMFKVQRRNETLFNRDVY